MKYVKIITEVYIGVNRIHLTQNELLTEEEMNKIIPLWRLEADVYEIVEIPEDATIRILGVRFAIEDIKNILHI